MLPHLFSSTKQPRPHKGKQKRVWDLHFRRPGTRIFGRNPSLNPIGQRRIGDVTPQSICNARRRNDASRIRYSHAQHNVRTAHVTPPHALLNICKPMIKPQSTGSHLNSIKHPHPFAIAHDRPRNRNAPAVFLGYRKQTNATRHHKPPQIIQRQCPAIVQLNPQVNIPRPADVVRNMGPKSRQRRRIAVDPEFFDHTDDRIHAHKTQHRRANVNTAQTSRLSAGNCLRRRCLRLTYEVREKRNRPCNRCLRFC